MSALNLGELARARAPLEESLEIFRRHGFRKGEATTIKELGSLAQMQGDADGAVKLLEQSAAIAAQEGFTWWQATVLANLAELELGRNRPKEAATRARQALRLGQRIGDRQLTVYALATSHAPPRTTKTRTRQAASGAPSRRKRRGSPSERGRASGNSTRRGFSRTRTHISNKACERGESCRCKRQSRKRSPRRRNADEEERPFPGLFEGRI